MNVLTLQPHMHTLRASAPGNQKQLVWLIVPSRWAFAALTFASSAIVARLLGSTDPVSAAGSWWMVSGTLVDVLCLIALGVAVRGERIRLPDLVGQHHLWRDAALGLVLIVALLPALAINQAVTAYVYGGSFPPQIALVHLPLWATVYSVAVWPVLWAFTEQLMYLGYLFPCLEQTSHSRLFAGTVIVAFWALQHTALPFVPDATYLVYRTITVIPVAITAVVLYLFVTRRRLLPLMIMHMVADAFAAVSPLLLFNTN